MMGAIVAREMDLRSTGRGFDDFRPPHFRAAVLGKSFTGVRSAFEVMTNIAQ